jgi:hypothetical protein
MLIFVEDPDRHDELSRIGIDCQIRTIERDGKSLKLPVRLTARQERLRTLRQSCCQSCRAASTSPTAWHSTIPRYLSGVDAWARADVCSILIGGKIDPGDSRAVRAMKAAQRGVPFKSAAAPRTRSSPYRARCC